ncbi:MAG: PSD1 and planctomycete cytochrome C domain-containing protein [Pirellula sp.]
MLRCSTKCLSRIPAFAWVACVAYVSLPIENIFAQESPELEQFFEAKVRPLFIKHCVECHGPEEQSGDLRLDLQAAATKGGSTGPAFVAGETDKSLLVRAVQHKDSKLKMPPDGKLKDEQIATLVEWVRSGAYWPKDKDSTVATSLPPAQRIDEIRESHWAYRPVVEHTPPSVSDTLWPQQAIDRFILSKLEAKGLKPNPIADRRTLMLRAHFTLTGLPPTYDEMEAFVADSSPNAFEKLVDRLLESGHYGERWARHWLDVARFAETTGYQAGSRDTRYPYAYTYRDYVIRALNDDKPFDQFIIEQLAADHLQPTGNDLQNLAALGFLTVGRKFMGNPNDIIDDQIDVVTRAFLGTSVACARCHDHKYDPLPTADYYSLYGVFASSREPDELPLLGDPTTTPGYDEFLAAKALKQKEVDAWLEKKRVSTEDELRTRLADYLTQLTKTDSQSSGRRAKRSGERGVLRARVYSRWQEFMASPTTKEHPIWGTLVRINALPADNFKDQISQLLKDDTFVGLHPTIVAALQSSVPESATDAALTVGKKIEEIYAQWKALKKKDDASTRLPDDNDEGLRLALLAEDNPTSLTSDLMIANLDQGERNEYNVQLGKVRGVEATHHGAPGRGMVLVDKPTLTDPVIFRRGQPGNRGDQVPRRFLQLLSHVDGGKPFTQGSGRLELAQAIASPNNPLTPRVIVNRIWQHHYGVGLVSTASDFGSRGDAPSHPELLDYIAGEFVKDGWSIKRLQKRIMMSATWQQSSNVHSQGKSIDPENRLVWHMPRRRLEFEPLRDRLLSTTEKLDRTIGGRSVMIHEDALRRGLYAYVDREDIPGLLASFDLPSPDASQATRARTTVPQQALFLINSKFVIGQAEILATKSASMDSTVARIKSLYRGILARDPSDDELALAIDFIQADRSVDSTFGSKSDSPPKTDPWVELSQVLLLSNEFTFVD